MARNGTKDLLIHNFVTESGLKYELPKKVLFWDETLRDGEQTAGVYFTPDEKLELARAFDAMGIHIADCGIPAVSEKEKEAVKKIAKAGLDMSILAACRTLKSDIDACIDCDVDEISPFIAASPVHLKHKLNMTEDQVVEKSVEAVEYGKDHGFKVTFVTEDTVRADIDFVERLYNAAIDAGADRVLLCDTVGVMTPRAFQWWLSEVMKRLGTNVEYGVHIHNDFGMATANSLAALEKGVTVVNTTFGGLGERAGNAPFEEIAFALELLYKKKTGLDLSKTYEISRRVEELSGVPIGITKPIVGYNAFTHESGIHTDGVIKNTLTYEPIQVEMLNRRRRFVFGKHTGTRAIETRLAEYGITGVDKATLVRLQQGIKHHTEEKLKAEQAEFIANYRDWDENHKGVTPREFWRLAREAGLKVPSKAEKELTARAR